MDCDCLRCRQQMRRITRPELENSITQAQFTICLQHLREDRCPACDGPKEYYRSFCKTCYFCLPLDIRARMWIERDTPENVTEFVTAYLAAKQFLRECGRSEAIA